MLYVDGRLKIYSLVKLLINMKVEDKCKIIVN